MEIAMNDPHANNEKQSNFDREKSLRFMNEIANKRVLPIILVLCAAGGSSVPWRSGWDGFILTCIIFAIGAVTFLLIRAALRAMA